VFQGALKKKRRALTWLVGSSEAKKVPGLGLVRFFDGFLCVFFTPYRETPKNVIKKNRGKDGLGFFCRFFCKNFSARFFIKRFL
jgi:hypothetical protein